MKSKVVVTAAAVLVALVLAAGASGAKKPSAYRGQGAAVQNQVQAGVRGESAVKKVKTVGGLPFTGLDLAFVVGGGLVLLLAGGTLRRVSRKRA